MMTEVDNALAVLGIHARPNEELLTRLKVKNDQLWRENSDLSAKLEKAEAIVRAVESIVAAAEESGDNWHAIPLPVRVNNALQFQRALYKEKTAELNREVRSHEAAIVALAHHTRCLVGMYDEAARHVLFGIGEPPDLEKILGAIDAALEKLR